MLKGLGGLGDMAKMMKSAQELQGKMTQLQEDMHNMMVTGESGAGLVKATCSAKGELKALDIDPSIFNGDDKEVVEDLIAAEDKWMKFLDDAVGDISQIPEQDFSNASLLPEMIECLAEILWEAQRDNVAPDERRYLERLRQL